MHHTVARIDGLRVSVYEWSDQDHRAGTLPSQQTALLYLHGLGLATGLQVADLVHSLLAVRTMRVIAPDMPGFGESDELPLEGYRPEGVVAWLCRVLDEKRISRCVAVGHSWGAVVACHLATTRPELVGGLVLLDGGYFDLPAQTPADARQRAEAHHRSQSFSSTDDFLETIKSHRPAMSSATEAAYMAAVVTRGGRIEMRQRPEVAAAISVASGDVPVSATYPAITRNRIPVLLAVPGDADSDPRAPIAQEFLSLVPGTRILRLPGCTHFLPQDAGGQLGTAIAEWLAETDAAGASGRGET